MARFFDIELRDNAVHYSTEELVASLEALWPHIEFYIEEIPALAGGASYFLNARRNGAFLRLKKADGMQLSFSSTSSLEECLKKIAASLAAAQAGLLPSGKPRPVKRR